MSTTITTHDGVRIYGGLLLPVYDLLIMKLLSPFIWRCPERHFHDLYRKCMSDNHADVGVGTGYVLDRCHFEPGSVRIGLFDLQQNCLDYTARRLARFNPEVRQCDAMEPIPFGGARFNSVALGGILHCIPGDMGEKGAVFDALLPLMHPGATLFGYTILNQGVRKTFASRAVYLVLHKLRVINGVDDSAEQLTAELNRRFNATEVRVIGCVAIFTARMPR